MEEEEAEPHGIGLELRGINTGSWFLRNMFFLVLFTEITPKNKDT